jgi:NAD(P)-dependent dehydrogenase (short-subunit alcohol dehydrogenase family)
MDLHLAGSVILITGGTDGLGAALAERLVEEGARVAVCGRNRERLADTQLHLQQLGGDVLAVQADVTKQADMENFVRLCDERWHRIDGLVNNAGRHAAAPIESVTDADWIADLELKVLAAARGVRLVLPHLRAAGGGSIVNVLAISGKTPPAGSLPTAPSRAAGLALSKSLSKELGPQQIRVNAILIGLVRSGQWRHRAEASGQPLQTVYDELLTRSDIPLGRIGSAGEFADLAAYLLSDRSSYVTGSAINLDGGSSPVG